MKLAISSYTFSWGFGTAGYPQPAAPLTPERLLAIARSMSVSTVQIADNSPLDELDPSRLDELIARARDEGITLELGTSGTDPENLRRYVQLATRCGAEVLRSVPKGTVAIGDEEADRAFTDATVASVSSVVDELEAAGVTLCLENYEGYSVHSLRRAIDRLASTRVRVCLDSLNSLGRSEGYETVVDALADVTGNLHVKDYRARRLDHRLGYLVEGTPAGEGDLPIRALLRTVPPDVSVVLEQWTPWAGSIEETTTREMDWARRSVAYLAPLVEEIRTERAP